MSFTASNNNTGGMPDISARMMPVGQSNNYESQGMERAVVIGQDGRPIGNVESLPPFDLLTEANRNIIEQRKIQKEAQRRKQMEQRENKNKPKVPVIAGDVLSSIKQEIIGKSFNYITNSKFGTIVEVEDCVMKDDEIELVMNDGHRILLEDLESQFIPETKFIEDSIIEEAVVETPKSKIEPKRHEAVAQKAVSFSSGLPNSPLRDLLSSRKKNTTNISVDIDIDLVKKDFFNIIDDSYDNAIDYVIEHVMNNLTLDQVKSSIKKKLLLYYKSEENSIINEEFENKEIYKEPETIILEKSQ